MKITFLDAQTMGANSLSPIQSLGELETYPTTSPAQLHQRIKDSEIIITNKVVINADAIAAAPKLKLICVAATGTNCIDLQAAEANNIPVKNVAGYSTSGVCQHVIGMMINLASNIHLYANEIKHWPESPMFTRLDHPMIELRGKKLGIVGLGSIGKSVANVAQALGMNVIALAREGQTSDNGNRLPAEQFFAEADFISLHCPLTDDTKDLINSSTLKLMKASAFLINTGRGDLINEADLLDALESGAIAGAALDVLTQEPPSANHPLIKAELPNLFITPHTAWACEESRDKLILGIAENIKGFSASPHTSN